MLSANSLAYQVLRRASVASNKGPRKSSGSSLSPARYYWRSPHIASLNSQFYGRLKPPRVLLTSKIENAPPFSTNAHDFTEKQVNEPKSHVPDDIEPMDKRLLFQYLQLKTFTEDEIGQAIDRIHELPSNSQNAGDDSILRGEGFLASDTSTLPSLKDEYISEEHVTAFILERIIEISKEQEKDDYPDAEDNANAELVFHEANQEREQMMAFAKLESQKIIRLLCNDSNTCIGSKSEGFVVRKSNFRKRIHGLATEIDTSRTIPISSSMLLVGSSVGIVIPAMPYIVSNLGLTTGQYGIVVSSFAFAKLFANIPAAVLVERHGRKPYLVHSLVIMALGMGGVGLATQFEHLIVSRTLTGIGVSLFSTAATLSIADISTPLNRARTMAPMMSSFAAGTALGPAVGGLLADRIGINSLFYLGGGLYLALASINQLALNETKIIPEKERIFPWQNSHSSGRKRRSRFRKKDLSVGASIQGALTQWSGLLEDKKVRNVIFMNGFYWVALSGAQMTLLPLILTDPTGLNLTATNVGEIYMGMSLVQVFGNPAIAGLLDKMGKVPGIVVGCSVLSAAMFTLPYSNDITGVAGTLAFWSLGSTILSSAPTAYINNVVREDQRAQAIALLRTSGDIGLLFGATSTGAVADLFNMNVAVHTSATLLLTATGWFAARRYIDLKETKSI